MLAAWLGSVQLQRVVLVVGNISVYVCLFLPLFESMSNAATFYLRVVHSQPACGSLIQHLLLHQPSLAAGYVFYVPYHDMLQCWHLVKLWASWLCYVII